jgi:TetR/AcrR family transcriptional regulator, cholesterol catabolism regulator
MSDESGETNTMARPNRSAQRLRQIIQAAAVLFDELGYHRTGMEDIAEAVGLSKPTLYHYTKSKGELVFWIHDEIAVLMLERLRARIEAGTAPEENLFEVIADTLEIMDTHPGYLRVFLEHHRDIPEEYREQAQAKRDEYFTLVRGVVEEGVELGVFATDDPRLTALALHGMANWAYQWYRTGGTLASREIAGHLWSSLVFGLATPKLREVRDAAPPASRSTAS